MAREGGHGADFDALLAVNRRLHAEIAQAQNGDRCGRCWALTTSGHYPDCPVQQEEDGYRRWLANR